MRHRLLIFITLLATGLGGCTQQDILPCNDPAPLGTAEIAYSYTLNNSKVNLYDTRVNRVAMYIFDSNGYFHSEVVIQGSDLIKNDLPVTLTLPLGRYSVVTFGGDSHLYELQTAVDVINNIYNTGIAPAQTHKEQFRLAAKINSGVIEPLNELYGSPVEIPIVVEQNKVNKYFSELIKDTHLLNIGVSGLDNLPTKVESPLSITVTGNNTRLFKDNSIDNSRGVLSYSVNQHSFDNTQVTTSVRIMRVDASSKINIDITHLATGRKIASFDLVKVLLATPQFKNQRDFDREDEYNLFLTIDANHVLTLKVNGWKVINVGII